MPRDVFETFYGVLYDSGIQHPLAPRVGALAWGADVPRAFAAMAEAAACRPDEIVLDCPTGGGVTFSRGLPETRGTLLAVDLSSLMLGRAAVRRSELARPDVVALVRADAMRLPLRDSSVHRVLCFNSLHCIPGHLQVLREFRRVLRPGGRLAGTTLIADAPLPWRATVLAARLSGFFQPPDSRRLARDARAAGFESWRAERTGALLFFNGQ